MNITDYFILTLFKVFIRLNMFKKYFLYLFSQIMDFEKNIDFIYNLRIIRSKLFNFFFIIG